MVQKEARIQREPRMQVTHLTPAQVPGRLQLTQSPHLLERTRSRMPWPSCRTPRYAQLFICMLCSCTQLAVQLNQATFANTQACSKLM